MENYREEIDLAEELEFAESEEERNRMQARTTANNARLDGNLAIVYEAITQLLVQLTSLTELAARLQPTSYDTLGRDIYFADFILEIGGGYTHDNFRQDLRNFKSFLEYAKSKGSRTVFFRYG
ncbi:MAG TPA: hypothetical protein VFO93_17405 [Hymenobacter sp.]|uniref:hypothetical protein n=1 Tax=Hymenobacter sp. TaxID=1898978 RepID=UPI002D7E1C46|nr:hypothetical protein [Hymenobacter sp.]HET9505324.1 hypothetical protein [Hymenobacter sp.]